jgi:hypothetical protein
MSARSGASLTNPWGTTRASSRLEVGHSPRDLVSLLLPDDGVHGSHREPWGQRSRGVAAVPAPHWFFRFMYDRQNAVWERDATSRRTVSWSSGPPMSL